MKIYCTVLRKNGTYNTVPVKAGRCDFELDGNKYNVNKFRIGNIGPIKILRAIYHEGLPDPMEFDIDYEMKKANLKIDSKAIKNVTNKKILDVFGQEEFTKLEKLVVLLVMVNVAITAINLVLNVMVAHKAGVF